MKLEKTNWNRQGTVVDGVEKEVVNSVTYNIANSKGEQMGSLNVHIGGFSMNVTREFGSVEEMTSAIQSALNEMYKEEV